jgi:hypothetical protein
MKIEVNLRKKYFFSLLTILVIISGLFAVYGYNRSSGDPATMGHTSNELEVNISGTIYTLQDAINQGKLTGSASTISFYDAGPASGTETISNNLGFHNFCALSRSSIALDNYVNWKSDICGLIRDTTTGNWTLTASVTNSYIGCSATCLDYTAGTASSSTPVSDSGTLCGLSIVGDLGATIDYVQCQGSYPSKGCPSSYTYAGGGRIIWDEDYYRGYTNAKLTGARLNYCVKN